jgi:hypothetical protein
MRPGQLIFVLGITSTFLGAIAVGCGSSSSTSLADSGLAADGTAADALPETGNGIEASVDASAEASTSTDAGTDADALPLICEIDADVTHLNVPDASIGDSGLSLAACYSCIQTSCGTEVTACQGDCTCKVSVQNFVTCLAGGKAITACALQVIGSSDPTTTGLFTCLATSTCTTICGG